MLRRVGIVGLATAVLGSACSSGDRADRTAPEGERPDELVDPAGRAVGASDRLASRWLDAGDAIVRIEYYAPEEDVGQDSDARFEMTISLVDPRTRVQDTLGDLPVINDNPRAISGASFDAESDRLVLLVAECPDLEMLTYNLCNTGAIVRRFVWSGSDRSWSAPAPIETVGDVAYHGHDAFEIIDDGSELVLLSALRITQLGIEPTQHLSQTPAWALVKGPPDGELALVASGDGWPSGFCRTDRGLVAMINDTNRLVTEREWGDESPLPAWSVSLASVADPPTSWRYDEPVAVPKPETNPATALCDRATGRVYVVSRHPFFDAQYQQEGANSDVYELSSGAPLLIATFMGDLNVVSITHGFALATGGDRSASLVSLISPSEIREVEFDQPIGGIWFAGPDAVAATQIVDRDAKSIAFADVPP